MKSTPKYPNEPRTGLGYLRLFVVLLLFAGVTGQDATDAYSLKRSGPAPKDMIRIPEGTFVMGSDARWPDEGPMHIVYLESYYIDKYEVTNSQYQKFIDSTDRPPPMDWENNHYPSGKINHPVVFVTWFDANDYCHWRDKRLPTDAEWEKAARGPEGWIYPWGNFFDYRRANVGGIHSGPMPVGSFPLGRSPYGASDMIGNVWEWTADWYGPYPGTSYTTPNFGKSYRVARGNSFAGLGHFSPSVMEEVEAVEARVSYRLYFPPNIALEDLGFRCAKDESGKHDPER